MTTDSSARPRRWPGALRGLSPRAFGVLWLLGLAGAVVVAWAAFRLVPFWTWSAARLAASARLAYGFPLYTPPGDAMVNGWVYGPVSAIAYLPALAAGEPLAALQLATGINAFFFLVPPLLVSARLWGRREHRRDGLLVATFGVATLLVPFGTWYGAAALGADTVAICLGVTSCLALLRGPSFPLAALLCALAAWSKQTAAPLALAQLAYLGWTRGAGAAARHAAWLALAAVGTWALFGAWFGFGALWHGTVSIPSRHPLEAARLPGLALAFAGSTWWVWLLLPWVRRWRGGPADGTPAPFLIGAGHLLLLASLMLLPGGLAAAAKAGGDQNSLHSLAYAILGGAALLGAGCASPAERTSQLSRHALLAGLLLAAGAGLHRVVVHDHLAIRRPGEQHREAFAFARTRPGQVYYPCNPLITLMAERRDLPFDYGVYDWRLAGTAPAPEALRRLLPPSLTFVVYHEKDPSRELLRMLPEFARLHQTGPWDMYLRAPAEPAP